MNSIRSYRNLLKNFIFFHFLRLEEYEQGALRKEPVVATFIKRFQKATLRMSYWQIRLAIRLFFSHFIFVGFLLIEVCGQGALEKEVIIATSVKRFKTATLRKYYW